MTRNPQLAALAASAQAAQARPLVLHVVYRFDVGGLENGVVNLINHMPADAFRHAVVALTDATAFARRIQRPDVDVLALHKPPGHGVWMYPQLFSLFRSLRPAIVHTRNIAALEAVVPAWLAGVPVRVHSEHGRDIGDLTGANRRYQWMRRMYRPFVNHYVALSRDLSEYLVDRVRVPPTAVSQFYNGVDTERFRPADGARQGIVGCPFASPTHWLVGTVGRMQPVKDQVTLVRAFVRALQLAPGLAQTLRLVLVGDGALRAQCEAVLDESGMRALAWLSGERSDIDAVLRGLDCFALPSLAEGISNTILEAMASGLPVIATAVGGNADLVSHGRTGLLVAAADPEAMARAIVQLASEPQRAARMGRAGRAAAEQCFSLQTMVSAYQGLYESQLRRLVRKGH
jgi:sugar transferase (PEP-CTERM/EpsH1 system associated)